MTLNREGNQVPIEQIARSLEQIITGVHPERAAGLERLQRFRSAKTTQLQREQARLSEKLGADHPLVREVAQKIELNQALVQNVTIVRDQLQVDVPVADSNTWILHGFVRNSQGLGMPNLTVALYNQRGVWLEQFGFTCTQSNGYFKLTCTVAKDHTVAGFIEVLDQQKTLLYVAQTTSTPTAGQVDYRQIVLSAQGGSCSPPDSDGTGVAVNAKILTLLAVPTSLDVSIPVRFSAEVEGTQPIAYAWDFGDSSTDTTATPSHTYSRPGSYTVSLTVQNAAGTDTRSLLIIISRVDPEAWLARGRVTDDQEQGLEGLIVSLFDHDLIFDDRLGTTQTDGNGDFAITYHIEDFQDLFEARPDLYIKVMDQASNTLYSSEDTVRFDAGRVEVFKITISTG
jgi:PKD repeat protein